ncbi:permease-like cell division protein FtsX [Nonomuraea sp. NPDC059023]|uniref:permease-like cell division protein FtsX n=1 Tax=unclassified Nonomuraea TaxID=2593643 RepID=UPI003681B55B
MIATLTTVLAASGGVAAADSVDPPEAGAPTGADGAVKHGASPLPPPKGAWPKSGTLTVYLCAKDSALPGCRGRAATAEQKRRLERLLKRLPGVSGLRFEDQEEAYRNFRDKYRDNKPLIAAARKSDMAESFRAKVEVVNTRQTDRLAKLNGVASVYAWRTDFWVGKAHAKVSLCAPSNEPGLCEGQTTDPEREAIFEALRNLQGVKKIYLEPREHAAKNWRRVFATTTLKPKVIASFSGEIFHLVLANPADLAPITAALKGLPGVKEISLHR